MLIAGLILAQLVYSAGILMVIKLLDPRARA